MSEPSYERRKQAVDNLARDIAKHGGLSSEKAHQKAAEVARETDKKRNDSKKDG
jgi:hypothetical protein